MTLRHTGGPGSVLRSRSTFLDGRTFSSSANGDNTVKAFVDMSSGGELAHFVAHHDPGRPWDLNAGVGPVRAASPDGRARSPRGPSGASSCGTARRSSRYG